MTLSFWFTLFSPQGRPLSFKTFLIWVLISIYQGEEEPFIVKEQIPVLDNLNKTHLSLDITEIFQMCWDLRMSSTSGIVNNSNLAWASSEVLETTSASRCSLKLYVAKVVSSQTWKISPVTLQRSKGVLVLLAATSSKSFSLHNTHWQQLWPSPKGINSPGAFLSQERVRNRHLCSLGKNWPSCAGASEQSWCWMFAMSCDLSLCAVAALRRKHHHVRRAAALRVRVRAHRRHLLHLADPDGAADGGSDHSDVALAHDRGRAPQLGLLRRLARLPARVHRWANA